MRTIVVGQMTTIAGVQQIGVWFRFPVVGANRIAYYAKVQAAAQPQAPGDYAGADLAEVSALQSGTFAERAGFLDVIDPTSTLPQIQTRLVNIYTPAALAFKNADDAGLANWASSYNGTTWTMKVA
jgi:hypothetical protein